MALKLLVSLISRLVACSPRIVADRHTDGETHRTTTVTLAAHARRGLITNVASTIDTDIVYSTIIIYLHVSRIPCSVDQVWGSCPEEHQQSSPVSHWLWQVAGRLVDSIIRMCIYVKEKYISIL